MASQETTESSRTPHKNMRRAASFLGWRPLVLALLRGIVGPVEECF